MEAAKHPSDIVKLFEQVAPNRRAEKPEIY